MCLKFLSIIVLSLDNPLKVNIYFKYLYLRRVFHYFIIACFILFNYWKILFRSVIIVYLIGIHQVFVSEFLKFMLLCLYRYAFRSSTIYTCIIQYYNDQYLLFFLSPLNIPYINKLLLPFTFLFYSIPLSVN